jgi:hypothetical protein
MSLYEAQRQEAEAAACAMQVGDLKTSSMDLRLRSQQK